ncbi:hypothetical protein MT418_006701 [Batrachochytrium dendrobatidis]
MVLKLSIQVSMFESACCSHLQNRMISKRNFKPFYSRIGLFLSVQSRHFTIQSCSLLQSIKYDKSNYAIENIKYAQECVEPLLQKNPNLVYPDGTLNFTCSPFSNIKLYAKQIPSFERDQLYSLGKGCGLYKTKSTNELVGLLTDFFERNPERLNDVMKQMHKWSYIHDPALAQMNVNDARVFLQVMDKLHVYTIHNLCRLLQLSYSYTKSQYMDQVIEHIQKNPDMLDNDGSILLKHFFSFRDAQPVPATIKTLGELARSQLNFMLNILKPSKLFEELEPKVIFPFKTSKPRMISLSKESEPQVIFLPEESRLQSKSLSKLFEELEPRVILLPEELKSQITTVSKKSEPQVIFLPEESKLQSKSLSKLFEELEPRVILLPEKSKPRAVSVSKKPTPQITRVPKEPKVSLKKSKAKQIDTDVSDPLDESKADSLDVNAMNSPTPFLYSQLDGMTMQELTGLCKYLKIKTTKSRTELVTDFEAFKASKAVTKEPAADLTEIKAESDKETTYSSTITIRTKIMSDNKNNYSRGTFIPLDSQGIKRLPLYRLVKLCKSEGIDIKLPQKRLLSSVKLLINSHRQSVVGVNNEVDLVMLRRIAFSNLAKQHTGVSEVIDGVLLKVPKPSPVAAKFLKGIYLNPT